MLKLGLVQMRCSIDREENIDRAEAKAREAAAQGAKIICLPEIFSTIYFCQVENHKYFNLAEEIPGPTVARFRNLAAEIDAAIVTPLFEKRASGLYHNAAAIIDADGSYLGKYRKMHIPDDPLFYEKFYFTPGDLGFKSWKTWLLRCGTESDRLRGTRRRRRNRVLGPKFCRGSYGTDHRQSECGPGRGAYRRHRFVARGSATNPLAFSARSTDRRLRGDQQKIH
jgi:hypothetical protein